MITQNKEQAGNDMTLLELFIIAVGLSMDAFAVAICKGLNMRRVTFKNALIIGLYFGIFQALMPLTGYFLGGTFSKYIERYDHWIAFALLAVIGGKMIWESFHHGDDEQADGGDVSFKTMLPLAVATSIDALMVGVSFAFLKVSIVPAVSFIGAVTLTLSMLGVWIGKLFGDRFQSKAELAGGIILVLMGLKILLEHLDLLPF